jgi:hypothetical protein
MRHAQGDIQPGAEYEILNVTFNLFVLLVETMGGTRRADADTTARMSPLKGGPPQGAMDMDKGATPGMGEIDRVGNERSRATSPQGWSKDRAIAEAIRQSTVLKGGNR